MALAPKKPEAPTQQEVVVISTIDLYEPYLHVRIPANTPITFDEWTPWMQGQADSGLLKVA